MMGLANISLQSVFQKAASHPVLQHDAIHIQHGHDAEGKGQHSLLVSAEARHVWLRRETSHVAAVSR